MKKLLFILFPIYLNAQTTDTLLNAKAYAGTFQPIMGLVYIQAGLTTSGHIWMVGINLRYSGSTPLPVEFVRADITAGTTTTKIIDFISSNTPLVWRSLFDSSGNLYLSLNSTRIIAKCNFKDSIYIENIGNPFNDGGSLAYSSALGRDKNMYFGSSSGAGPAVSYYNTVSHTFTKYSVIDDFQDYVLSVQGDSNWIYAQVGQRQFNSYWAIRKSDGYKKKLDSIPSSSVFNVRTYPNGVFVQYHGIWYKATDTTLTPTTPTGTQIEYYETVDGVNTAPQQGYHTVSSFYDAVAQSLMFNVDGVGGSMSIPATSQVSTVRRVFASPYDSTFFIYCGEQYGYEYRYSNLTNDTTRLGYIGFNVYSCAWLNDSLAYIGGYPSGITALYNKNQAWTAETFFGGSMHHLSTMTNPKFITYFRTNTPAQFHHNQKMIVTTDGYTVAIGDVIRTQLTASLGVINHAHNDTAYGYNADNMPDNMAAVDVAQWRDKVIFSTLNNYNSGCKLYVYDYRNNVMTDSINLGFLDYGNIYIIGDKLIGVANNKIYNYNLATKTLINSHTYSNGTITFSYQMPDGRILIKGNISIPTDMCFSFISYTGTDLYNMTASIKKLYTVTNNGLEALRLNNYFYSDVLPTSAYGLFLMNKRKLNLQ